MKDADLRADETDLALVNALQLQPRASWARIGRTLGISAVTAARRWQRLSAAGVAWVTAYGLPGPQDRGCVAFLDLDCDPGRIRRLAEHLAEEPHVLGVDHVSQGADLQVTAAFTDLATVSRYTTDRLGRLPGITSVRVHLATGFHTEGKRWKLDSLEPAQRRELRDEQPVDYDSSPHLRPEERQLLIALGTDGRLGHTELAESTGLSPSTVRRRIDRLVAADAVRFRCEISSHDAGRPVSATYWAALPPHRLDEIGPQLARLSEARLCVSVTGAHNLLFSVWLRSLAAGRQLESTLGRRFPDLVVAERRVSLRSFKRMGRILDPQGRAVRAVPMDIWRDPVPPPP